MSSRDRGLALIDELRSANRITFVEAEALQLAIGSKHASRPFDANCIGDTDFCANKFLTERIAKGLTQSAIADAIGVSHQAVGQWESGRSRPSVHNAKILRDFLLGVDVKPTAHVDVISAAWLIPTSFDKPSLQNWVRAVLNGTGWSAFYLSTKAGLSPSTISRFINDDDAQCSITAKSIDAIIQACRSAAAEEHYVSQ